MADPYLFEAYVNVSVNFEVLKDLKTGKHIACLFTGLRMIQSLFFGYD